jgi:hypothetical protein
VLKKPFGEINIFKNLRFTRRASCPEIAALFKAFDSNYPAQGPGYDCPLFPPPFPAGKGRLVRKEDNLTAICEPIV